MVGFVTPSHLVHLFKNCWNEGKLLPKDRPNGRTAIMHSYNCIPLSRHILEELSILAKYSRMGSFFSCFSFPGAGITSTSFSLTFIPWRLIFLELFSKRSFFWLAIFFRSSCSILSRLLPTSENSSVQCRQKHFLEVLVYINILIMLV